MATVGIHLVWTTYGTWLPGDKRGHWSPLFDFYGHIVEQGGLLRMPDTVTRECAEHNLKEEAFRLDSQDNCTVAESIGLLVAGGEKSVPGRDARPQAYAATVEPDHVHLLLGPVGEEIGRCAGRLKGTSSSAVLKRSCHVGRSRVWTTGYWKVFLFDTQALQAVKEYIEQHNVRKSLPPVPFPWISPITEV